MRSAAEKINPNYEHNQRAYDLFYVNKAWASVKGLKSWATVRGFAVKQISTYDISCTPDEDDQ